MQDRNRETKSRQDISLEHIKVVIKNNIIDNHRHDNYPDLLFKEKKSNYPEDLHHQEMSEYQAKAQASTLYTHTIPSHIENTFLVFHFLFINLILF